MLLLFLSLLIFMVISTNLIYILNRGCWTLMMVFAHNLYMYRVGKHFLSQMKIRQSYFKYLMGGIITRLVNKGSAWITLFNIFMNRNYLPARGTFHDLLETWRSCNNFGIIWVFRYLSVRFGRWLLPDPPYWKFSWRKKVWSGRWVFIIQSPCNSKWYIK